MKFYPNPTQAKFLESDARYLGFVAGIGSGKTCIGAIKTLTKIDQGEPGVVVAPDFPHFTKSTWPEWKKWIPWDRVRNRHLNHPYTQDKRLIFATTHGDVEVSYGGIDEPTSWQGPTVNWFWFDEAARKDNRDAFDILVGRIRTGNNPQGWVTTTPKGRNHWLYNVFVKQDFDPDIKKEIESMGVKLVEYFHASTKENAPNLERLYYLSLMGTYTGEHRKQEVGGLFVTFEGAVFEKFGEENITIAAEYIPGVPIEYGVDDGFTAEHPRVFLLSQEIPPYINVFAEYVCTYELPEVSIENLKKGTWSQAEEAGKVWPLAKVAYIDTSAAELATRLWDEDIDTIRSTHSVEEGIKHTRAFICDSGDVRRVRFHPRCEFSTAEIQSYAYPRKQIAKVGSGQPRPAKALDNAADALRYLLWSKSIAELDELASEITVNQAETIIRRQGISIYA